MRCFRSKVAQASEHRSTRARMYFHAGCVWMPGVLNVASFSKSRSFDQHFIIETTTLTTWRLAPENELQPQVGVRKALCHKPQAKQVVIKIKCSSAKQTNPMLQEVLIMTVIMKKFITFFKEGWSIFEERRLSHCLAPKDEQYST